MRAHATAQIGRQTQRYTSAARTRSDACSDHAGGARRGSPAGANSCWNWCASTALHN